jgi:hypothetical protein
VLFHPYGEVERVQIGTDRETRRSRGAAAYETPGTSYRTVTVLLLGGRARAGLAHGSLPRRDTYFLFVRWACR